VVCQFFDRNLFAVPQMTDVVILAKYTFKVTVGKKNGSGATVANQGPFFTKMRKNTGDYYDVSCFTNPNLPFQTVYFAFSGAEGTGLEKR